MFLKKVEISGFKSFAHKTTLEFLPACVLESGKAGKCGITAIVGPNGSGKSNVSDAIRWAMGEQSMKNLRGKKSEDIIFAGSGKKARLGSAYVTLHFDNADKRIPLEFTEVAITRKLFRSGESEYLINGSKSRLLDVADLLAKAGVGRESYCVINQGMTDAVLAATPLERRTILEDAAGVKQYQIKKERALRKMEASRNNLGRASDLIKEIEPHLRMLKRQAEKAQKGKEIAETLKSKQIELFSFLWKTFQREKDAASEEKNNLGIAMMNVQREVDKLNDAIAKEAKTFQDSRTREDLEAQKQVLYQKLNNLEKELAIAEGRIEIEREKIAQQNLIKTIPVDFGYVRAKIERARQNHEKLIARLEKTETLAELQEIKEFARAIQQELFDLWTDIGKGKVELPKKEVVVDNGRVRELEELKNKTQTEIGVVRAEIGNIGQKINAEVEKYNEARQQFFALEKNLHSAQSELDRFKDHFNESKIKLARVEVREEDLVAEVRNELKMEIKDLASSESECDRESLEREISRLKVQMEQIGGIDPLVVEEHDEVSKRYEFLTKESADLEQAIVSLQEVIVEMEEKISETFNQAFEKINKEFTNYFRIIFGGGNAHLVKNKIKNRRTRKAEAVEGVDADGDLETAEEEEGAEDEKAEIGVDISACPPGKKIINLSMLSGGERSLTSIALLFAIISYNPPPFAVLDEVEAALDEANSRRLGRILQELSGNTQFVIITHNRETMRQASLLYGVTMGEDGISKLLSVHLDQIGQGGKIVR